MLDRLPLASIVILFFFPYYLKGLPGRGSYYNVPNQYYSVSQTWFYACACKCHLYTLQK